MQMRFADVIAVTGASGLAGSAFVWDWSAAGYGCIQVQRDTVFQFIAGWRRALRPQRQVP